MQAKGEPAEQEQYSVKVEPKEEEEEAATAEESEATRLANFQLINSAEVRQWRTDIIADMERVAGNHESWLVLREWIEQDDGEASRAAVAAVCHEVNDRPECLIARAMLHAATVVVMEAMQGMKSVDDDLSWEIPEDKSQ